MPKDNKLTIQQLLNTLDPERLTKEDFVSVAENQNEFLKKIEKNNLNAIEKMRELSENVSNKLKEDNSVDLSDVRAEIKKVFDRALKDQTDGMNFIRDKVRKIRQPKDGLDADEEIIVDKVLDKIKLPEQKEILLDTPEQFKRKVEPIVERILEEIKKDIEFLKFRPMPTGSGATGGGIVKVFDLSDSLDGVLKTFSLPAFWRIISVTSSSFPTTFRPTTDYTTDEANSQITFTSEVDASTMLASGQSIIIVYAEA